MKSWLHFVGGFYTRADFVEEAQRQSISRRVAPLVAKRMEFGDPVYLGNWRHGEPVVFAQFTIENIFLDSDVAAILCQELAQDGQAEYVPGNSVRVVRACGTYVVKGRWVVSASMEDIVRRATKIAEATEAKPWFMIGGPLTKVYHPPSPISTLFFRGFKQLEDAETMEVEAELGGIVYAVDGYTKRKKRHRQDIQARLSL